jgi:hypothetical protein
MRRDLREPWPKKVFLYCNDDKARRALSRRERILPISFHVPYLTSCKEDVDERNKGESIRERDGNLGEIGQHILAHGPQPVG